MRSQTARAIFLGSLILIIPACGSPGSSGSPGSGGSSALGVNLGAFYADTAIETFLPEGRVHVPVGTFVDYHTDPPTSGNHYPAPQGGGFFEISIAPGYLVHSLEHGGVVIYYDPTLLTTTQKNTLKTMAQAHPGIFGQVVCVPRNDPAFPIILTAWTHRLRLTAYDQGRMDGFLTLFLGQGPETPWGTPTTANTSVAMSYSSGYHLQVTKTGRPGTMVSNEGMGFAAQSTTSLVDVKVAATSALADHQTVRFLSSDGTVLAKAVYDASTGKITFSIGSTTFPGMAMAIGSYHTVSFIVDKAGGATWSVNGAATGSVPFGNPIISMEFAVDYVSGTGAGPDFFFGNPLAGGP